MTRSATARRRDARFAAWTAGLTLAVPGLLLLLPMGEERARFGTLSGWGLALLIMVPSYALLSRAMRSDDPHKFIRSFMLGMILRMFATMLAVAGFYVGVEDAPLRSFLLAFFLGYGALTAVELLLTVRGSGRRAAREEHA